MTTWDKIEAAEKATILDNIAAVYEKHGHPSWLSPFTVGTQKVNVLMAGQRQEVVSATISGSAPIAQKDLAAQIKADLEAAAGSLQLRLDIKSCYAVGDQFVPIENAGNVMSEGTCTVQHNQGEVLLVDFWATWCPPCQAPMAHNQKMLEENSEKWGGKVRIIGLSIDNTAGAVKSHVEAKGWTKPEHYHVKAAGCTAQVDHGVAGVPHVLLVDTNGKIVFKGHPAKRPSFEDDFQVLLDGGVPQGLEEPSAGADAGAGGNSGPSDAEAAEAIEKFWTGSEAMMKDHADSFAAFPRAFLVLVDDAKFDARSKTMSHDMTCHTQIMGGSQEAQDACKPFLEAVNKGPWKNEDRFSL